MRQLFLWKLKQKLETTGYINMKKINDKPTDPVEYCESMYPNTMKEFTKLQEADYKVFCKKQMDYGPSNIAMGTGVGAQVNKKLATTALVVRINDKIQRLINLVIRNNREAQNEPTIDAFKDLACYGIIAQIVKNGKWGK